MTLIRVVNQTRGTLLGSRVRLADDMATRVRGFLFRPAPAPGEGILLSPCRAVHMYGVRFPLDIVFISEQGQVVATYRDLAPWSRSAMHGSALHALELPAGIIRASVTQVGDVLSWTAAEGEPEVDLRRGAAAGPGRAPQTEAETDRAARTDPGADRDIAADRDPAADRNPAVDDVVEVVVPGSRKRASGGRA